VLVNECLPNDRCPGEVLAPERTLDREVCALPHRSILPLHRLLYIAFLLAMVVRPSAGQAPPDPDVGIMTTSWRLVTSDGEVTLSETGIAEEQRIREVASDLLLDLRRQGHYFATVDSIAVEDGQVVRLYMTKGPAVSIGSLRVSGTSIVSPEELFRIMTTREGAVLDVKILDSDIAALLRHYEALGHASARIAIGDVSVRNSEGGPVLDVEIEVEEGDPSRIDSIDVVGGRSTTATLVRRLVGDIRGAALTGLDMTALRERLEDTGVFERVEIPRIELDSVGATRLVVEVTEAPAGSADLILGYLPGAPGRSGQFVGSGHLRLLNPLGDGRRFEVQLDRPAALTSSVRAEVSDPMIFNLPLRATARFVGVQRDSTYGHRAFQGELAYRISGGLYLLGTGSRELIRPGLGGQSPESGVARGGSVFAGLGLEYRDLDSRINPTRGLRLFTLLERGVRDREAASTLGEPQSLRQERFMLGVRAFLPTVYRQTFMVGLEGRLLRSARYDDADLVRLGGANSLRGYDEDRFAGRAAGRLTSEYRLLTDAQSHVFAFFDLGVLSADEGPPGGRREAFHPGYGIGAQLRTEAGLLTFSYGLNPSDGLLAGRLHFGISLIL
jgi:outer membrane protein assembly factor BamA